MGTILLCICQRVPWAKSLKRGERKKDSQGVSAAQSSMKGRDSSAPTRWLIEAQNPVTFIGDSRLEERKGGGNVEWGGADCFLKGDLHETESMTEIEAEGKEGTQVKALRIETEGGGENEVKLGPNGGVGEANAF